MLSVPENDISHIAHAQTVHENGTTGHMAGNFRFLLIQLQHISGMKDENVVLRNAQGRGNIRLGFHMTVLSVNRDRIFRMHQRIDQLDLLLAGMAGNMNILENHVGSHHGQLVDDLGNSFLVARNRIGA